MPLGITRTMSEFIRGQRILITVSVVVVVTCLVVFKTPWNGNGSSPVLIHVPRAGMFKSVVWKSFTKRRPFHSFISIPYARPPVGHLRFQPPVPLGPLEEVHNSADQVQVMCMQTNVAFDEPSGQEDCLFLNVYSPMKISEQRLLNSSSGLPVIIFIHGGFFTVGSGGTRRLGPHKFMDHDIVLVTINYRLGVLGFLTLENEYAPGNLGLRDQQLAMEWVKVNIGFFGGDPSKVTLMGQSAGGMSIGYHMVSPKAKNLFQGAIIMSGPVTSPAMNINLSPRMYAAGVAVALGCLRSSLEIKDLDEKGAWKLLDCLAKVPPQEMIKFNSYFTISITLSLPIVFKPVVDGHYTKDPVVPSDPTFMLKSGQFHKVPVMTGLMEQEGALLSPRLSRHPDIWDSIMRDWQVIGPLGILGRSPESVQPGDGPWVSMMTSEYFGPHESDPNKELQQLITLTEDSMFVYPQRTLVELLSQNPESAPVYSYVISHRPSCAATDSLLPKWQLALKTFAALLLGIDIGFGPQLGASHYDDILMIFSLDIPIVKDLVLRTPDDFRISQTLVSYLVNFASFGNPNTGSDTLNSAIWLPVAWPDNFDYLNISSKKTFELMYSKYQNRREEAWRKLDLGVQSFSHSPLNNGVIPLSRLDFSNANVDKNIERDYFGGAYLRAKP